MGPIAYGNDMKNSYSYFFVVLFTKSLQELTGIRVSDGVSNCFFNIRSIDQREAKVCEIRRHFQGNGLISKESPYSQIFYVLL